MAMPLLPSLSLYRRHLLRGRLRRLRSSGIHIWFIIGFGTACIIRLEPEKEARFEQKSRWKTHCGCLASHVWHSKPQLEPSAKRRSWSSFEASGSDSC